MLLICYECGRRFEKQDKEVRRQNKEGRSYFFCSRSCTATYANKVRHNTPDDGLKPHQRKTKKIESLLGDKLSTAKSRLNKLVLFALIQRCELDTCFRCGAKINNIEELSLDHKISWKRSEDPVKFFYDINNIAFSHLQCNSEAGVLSSSSLIREEAIELYYGA